MIKCETTNDKMNIQLTGDSFTLSLELDAIIKALANDKTTKDMVLDTIFLSLSKYYTKEEMETLIQTAFEAQQFSKALTESKTKNILDGLMDYIKNRLGEE